MKRYPHNPRYRLKAVYVLQREGLWVQASEMAHVNGEWLRDLDPLIKERVQWIVRYRSAESLLLAGRISEAAPLLDQLESGSSLGKLKDWLLLRRGNFWDALGKPDKAKPFYLSITDKKAQGLAENFLKTPFPAGPKDVMPSRWPIATIPPNNDRRSPLT